jgi:hypothetical protein
LNGVATGSRERTALVDAWSGAPCARPMVPTTFSPTIRSRSETQ